MTETERAASYSERVLQQQRAWLKLSYRQRLDWLWQAKLFAARALKAAAKARTR